MIRWPWTKEAVTPDLAGMSKAIADLRAKAAALKASEQVRVVYTALDPKNEGNPAAEYAGGDPAYQEWVANLLDDKRFQWLIYKRNMQMIDIMTAIPTGEPLSAEMRQRAAYRMDGIQMLVDDMVAIKRAYILAQKTVKEEGLAS
jgi:hypothetical protein